MLQGSVGAQVIILVINISTIGLVTEQEVVGATEAVNNGLVPDESFIQEKVLTSEVIASADYFSLRNVNLGL